METRNSDKIPELDLAEAPEVTKKHKKHPKAKTQFLPRTLVPPPYSHNTRAATNSESLDRRKPRLLRPEMEREIDDQRDVIEPDARARARPSGERSSGLTDQIAGGFGGELERRIRSYDPFPLQGRW